MTIDFERLEERAPEFAALRANGRGVGALLNMTTSFTLTARDAGTVTSWEADVAIAGPVGSMGQRVLQPIVSEQVVNVLATLEAKVAEAHAASGHGSDTDSLNHEPSSHS